MSASSPAASSAASSLPSTRVDQTDTELSDSQNANLQVKRQIGSHFFYNKNMNKRYNKQQQQQPDGKTDSSQCNQNVWKENIIADEWNGIHRIEWMYNHIGFINKTVSFR